jgi:hypothetical protein
VASIIPGIKAILIGLSELSKAGPFDTISKLLSDKAPAYGVVGLTYVKGKQNQHHMDAIVHGFHYIWKNKLAPMNKIIDAMAGKK